MIRYQTITPYTIQTIMFRHSGVGFGSTLLSVLGLVDYCKRYEVDLSIDGKGVLSLYVDDNSNPWIAIFKESTANIRYNHKRQIAVAVGMPPSCFFDYMMCCDDKTLFISDTWQQRFHDLWKSHVMFNDQLQELLNADHQSIDVSNMVGIHLRGTDHSNHGKSLPIEVRLDQVEERFSKDHAGVFVMTDEQQYLDAAINRFGSKVICLEGVARSNTKHPLHHNRATKNGTKILIDLVREMILLSKCKTQVLPRSGVAALVRCINPKVPYFLLKEDLSNHDLAKWKRSTQAETAMEIFTVGQT